MEVAVAVVNSVVVVVMVVEIVVGEIADVVSGITIVGVMFKLADVA